MRIVHASDLHFGEISATTSKPARSAHYFIDSRNKTPRPADLGKIFTGHDCFNSPELFVVSGDIGWSGQEGDYKYFQDFTASLRNKWRDTAFVISPGNHDLDLTISEDDKRQDSFLNSLKHIYGGDFDDIYKLMDPSYSDLTARERLVGIHYSRGRYLVVSANSAAGINKTSDPAYFRPPVLRAISEQIKIHRGESNLFRVFVLHHHLLPFYEPSWNDTVDAKAVLEKVDTNVVVNSARIQSWLSSEGFDLVLHGHKHLFHGREDTLWREGDGATARKIVILGAGSSGVTREELAPKTSHSANVIDVNQLNGSAWKLDAETFEIDEDSLFRQPRSLAHKKLGVGVIKESPIWTYNARDIVLCHAAIRSDLAAAGQVINFISTVEESTYKHPPTTAIGDREAGEAEVKKSFIAIHPEYDEIDGWNDTEKVDRVLANLSRSFRIQHGPRLFSRAAIIEPYSGLFTLEDLRPITRAIKALPGNGSRAYVGLYNLEKDAVGDVEPMPGLVGVQFIARDAEGYLDVIFTFRNLELSFWWVVNMLEASLLLDWACKMVPGRRYLPGRITFFSALAEWRKDPRPMFVSTIDKMKDEELFVLMVSTSAGSSGTSKILADYIEEKAEHTTALNIEYQGLERILGLAKGVIGLQGVGAVPLDALTMDKKFVDGIDSATELLRVAINDPKRRNGNVEIAKRHLKDAVSALRARI